MKAVVKVDVVAVAINIRLRNGANEEQFRQYIHADHFW